MATASLTLVRALRHTARRLESRATAYKWGHFGQCNCGHLAQTLTGLSDGLLQRAASQHRGDWSDQALGHQRIVARTRAGTPAVNHDVDYGDRPALDEGAWEPEAQESCTATDIPMRVVFEQLTSAGLDADDLVHLERLSDPRIRRELGTNTTDFHYASRENLVAYLDAWATLLEREVGVGDEPELASLSHPTEDGAARRAAA